MIKIENTITPSGEQWEVIIYGLRNPMNSWNKTDSYVEEPNSFEDCKCCCVGEFHLGDNDHELMMKLRNAGTDHRKFMRMITVYADITAPLYWWKEFDTYKVGTVANSCSTMHKIQAKEFTLDDFSHEHLLNRATIYNGYVSKSVLECVVGALNESRKQFIETKNKVYWWQMIQLLPTSYNQKRTVMLNYEVLANLYKSRKNHKLDEWQDFCKWIETLPYSELITGGDNDYTTNSRDD